METLVAAITGNNGWEAAIYDSDFNSYSSTNLLEKQYQIVVEYAVQNLQAVKATAYEASLLEIEEGDPLLHMERTMFDRNDAPVSHYVSLFRGDKYVFSSTLYR